MLNISKLNFLNSLEIPIERTSLINWPANNLGISLVQETGAHVALGLLVLRSLKKRDIKEFKSKALYAGLAAAVALVFDRALGIRVAHHISENLRALALSSVSLKYLSPYIHDLGHAIGIRLTIKNPNISIVLSKRRARMYFLLSRIKYLGIYLPKIPRRTAFGKYLGWWNVINVVVASGSLMDYLYASSQVALSIATRASFPLLSRVLLINGISEVARNIRRVFDVDFRREYSRMSYWASTPRPVFAILHVVIPIITAASFGNFKRYISFAQLVKSEPIITIWAINRVYLALKDYYEYRKKGFFSQFF